MALVAVVGLTLTLRRGLKPLMRGREGTLAGNAINAGINFGVTAATSAINVYLMRKGELESGIEVKHTDGDKETVGMSKIAAQQAITYTAISRIVYCIPCVLLPVAMQAGWRAIGVLGATSTTPIVFATNLFNVSFSLLVGLPLACAVFP